MIIVYVITVFAALTFINGNAVRDNDHGLIQRLANLNGCHAFPKSCKYACMTVDASGCLVCSCSGKQGSSSLSPGFVTADISGGNNNGCPALSSSCPASCVAMDGNGCVVCSCPSGGSTSTGSNSSSVSSSSGSSTGTSGNNNGCHGIPKGCASECTKINDMGCIVCECPAGTSVTNAIGSGTGSSSGTSGNSNGCQPFPKSCKSECMTINEMGCIVCNCPGTQTNSHQTSTGSGNSGGTSGNNNGCPAFPKSCKSECMVIDDVGCIICDCPASTTNNNTSGSGQTGSGSGLGFAVGVACPPFPKGCDGSCVGVDDMGCIVCTCPVSSNNATSTHLSAAGGGNGCPATDATCPTECVGVNSMGCVTCSCSSTNTGSGASNIPGTGCPLLPKNCPSSCLTINAGTGCVLCTCAQQTTAPPTPTVACPEFYVDQCSNDCVTLDANDCVVCACSGDIMTDATCGAGDAHSSGTPDLAFGFCEGSSNSTTQAPSGGNHPGGCPTFDPEKCSDAACIKMDAMGCMSCDCPATIDIVTGTTCGPGDAHSSGTPDLTFSFCEGPGNTTAAPGGGGQHPGGCATFDPDSCADASCVKMDAMGCMSCDCPATIGPGNTTAAPGGGGQHPGGCPTFDPDSCADASCVKVDAMGCMSCDCPVTIGPGNTTAAPGGGGQHPGGCPTFDPDSCADAACVKVDAMGCMSCDCPVTIGPGNATVAPSTAPSGGGNVHPGGCPSFDPMTCDSACVKMDGLGCMSCSCSSSAKPAVLSASTTAAPSGGGNLHPGGCPVFDMSGCAAQCISMDGNGCLTCQCPGTHTDAPTAQVPTSAPTVTQAQTHAPIVTQAPTHVPVVTQAPTNAPVVTQAPTRAPIVTQAPTNAPIITQAPTNAPVVTQAPTNAPIVTQAPVSTAAPATTTSPVLCPPVRCTAPCNQGIVMGANGCPNCKCPASSAPPVY